MSPIRFLCFLLYCLAILWALPAHAQQRPLFVFEGDSMTVDSPKAWPRQLSEKSAYVASGTVINVARRGTKTRLLLRDYDQQVHPVKPAPGQDAYYFLFMGSVDLARDKSTADEIFATLSWAWQKARADGFKVVAFTIKPATVISGDREQARQRLNQLILAKPAEYDLLVRTEEIFGEPLNSALVLGDGMHPNRAGHERMADYAADFFRSK